MDYTYHYSSPVGGITMASNGEALTGLWFDGQKYFASTLAKKHRIISMSPQAVGGAIAHNPFSLIIPCHRVVGSDGKLTGYAGGLDKKEWLLNMEKLHAVSE